MSVVIASTGVVEVTVEVATNVVNAPIASLAGGVPLVHNQLGSRSADNAHPMSAITGLEEALATVLSGAGDVPYEPTNEGDWDPSPDDVGEALDQLAARDLVPEDASDVVYDPAVDEDWDDGSATPIPPDDVAEALDHLAAREAHQVPYQYGIAFTWEEPVPTDVGEALDKLAARPNNSFAYDIEYAPTDGVAWAELFELQPDDVAEALDLLVTLSAGGVYEPTFPEEWDWGAATPPELPETVTEALDRLAALGRPLAEVIQVLYDTWGEGDYPEVGGLEAHNLPYEAADENDWPDGSGPDAPENIGVALDRLASGHMSLQDALQFLNQLFYDTWGEAGLPEVDGFKAINLPYEAGVPGDWDDSATPSIPENVAAALDALVSRLDLLDALGVNFDPNNPGDWESLPGNLQSALDALAARGSEDVRYSPGEPEDWDDGSATPVVPDDVAEALDLLAAREAGNPLPAGGSTNQVLAKNSSTDYDFKWYTLPGGGGGGGSKVTAVATALTSGETLLTHEGLEMAPAGYSFFVLEGENAGLYESDGTDTLALVDDTISLNDVVMANSVAGVLEDIFTSGLSQEKRIFVRVDFMFDGDWARFDFSESGITLANTYTGNLSGLNPGSSSLSHALSVIDEMSFRRVEISPQTSSHTLAIDDAGKVVEVDDASPATVTVPDDLTVPFPVGTVIDVYQAGAGTVSVAGDSGVTVRNAGSLSGQYATAHLRKRDTDEWVLYGDLS